MWSRLEVAGDVIFSMEDKEYNVAKFHGFAHYIPMQIIYRRNRQYGSNAVRYVNKKPVNVRSDLLTYTAFTSL